MSDFATSKQGLLNNYLDVGYIYFPLQVLKIEFKIKEQKVIVFGNAVEDNGINSLVKEKK